MSRLYLGRAYEQKRMYEEAIAALKESVDKTRGNPAHIGSLGYIYAVSGKRDEAHKLLKQLQELSKQSYVPATSMAMIYTGLGEKDRAFEMLQKAYEDRDVGLVDLYLKASPFWDSLRSDARFAELLRRMGLAP